MKCDVIRDLLPSYIDGLTSETSNQVIEEHLEQCKECRRYLEAMQKEMVSQRYMERSAAESKEEIYPFRKLKKVTRNMISVTILICITIFLLLYAAYENYYGYGKTADSENVDIQYSKANGVVTLKFVSKDKNAFCRVGQTDAEGNTLHVIEYHRKPWEEWSDYELVGSSTWSWLFLDENTILETEQAEGGVLIPSREIETSQLTGDKNIVIEFADQTKTIKLKELYTGERIEDLK